MLELLNRGGRVAVYKGRETSLPQCASPPVGSAELIRNCFALKTPQTVAWNTSKRKFRVCSTPSRI